MNLKNRKNVISTFVVLAILLIAETIPANAQQSSQVKIWEEDLTLPTYMVEGQQEHHVLCACKLPGSVESDLSACPERWNNRPKWRSNHF